MNDGRINRGIEARGRARGVDRGTARSALLRSARDNMS